IIDKTVPDPLKDRLKQYLDSDDWIRWDVATLIVFFPLFLFMFSQTHRARARDSGRRASGVQKWLTYLTLFIAASCLAGDGVSLVYNLLSGEITSRFLLKTMTVAIVAGGVFVYFLTDVRRDELE
ncbi:MAG: DUF5671 domain-containing protein, partial [Methylocella sp.]